MTGSHLWRALGATEALFSVTAHDAWDDSDLASLILTRGDGSAFGVPPATATVAVAGNVANSHDQPLAVEFTPAGADLVAALCGNRTAAELTPRWFGRIGNQTATDFDDVLERLTSLTAADWLTEVTRADPALVVTRDLPQLVNDVLDRADLPAGVPTVATTDPTDISLAGYWPNADPADAPTPDWSQVVQVHFGSAGNHLSVLRDGTPYMTTAVRVAERATEWSADSSEPLTRRQCVSPATWEQPTSSPAVVQWLTREPGPGGVFNIPHSFRVGSGVRPVRSQAVDLSTIGSTMTADVEQSIQYAMEGLAHRLGGWAYTVPTVTVDLLQLLTSDVAGDRAQAGQLLTAELLDPIALSYDWPNPVIGLYYITALSEAITPDAWTMTLGLAPTRHVTGQASPAVPGRTWDTAYPRATQWDDPPTTTTWDNAPE